MNEGEQYNHLLKCEIYYSEVTGYKCFMSRDGDVVNKERFVAYGNNGYNQCVMYLDNLKVECYYPRDSKIGYLEYIYFFVNGYNCRLYVPLNDFLKKPYFWTKNTLRRYKMQEIFNL